MAKTIGSVNKATKSPREHASSTTTVCELESSRPVQAKEPVVFLNKVKNERFHNNILNKLEFIFIREGLIPWDAANTNELYNTKVDVDEHSKFMDDIADERTGQKFYVGAILHQEKANYAARQTKILVFPSLVMLLCQQREIVSCAGKEILENKGPTNEASVKRMTLGKETPIVKEAETSKTRKDKAKVDRKGTNMNAETSLWCKLKDVKKMKTEIDQWHPHPLCKSLILRKKWNLRVSMNAYEILIANLRMPFLLIKKTLLLRRKLMLQKKKLLHERKLFLKKKVVENEKEKDEEDFIEKVVTAPEFVV
ncbi:hypothetical protein PVK06_030331 [Gossypium arboreum]|uniref:Uncharacterized protein n=1 Tax=Gossypium arboreum TaxID=29729 RepID=A0ABR0NNH4_GOSAR|nr:hypothetical protein PVK06_030331 [Gossypium arboreum]